MTTTVETFACHDCQLLSPSAQRMPAARLLCRIRLPLQHASPVLLHPSHSWHRHHEGQTIPVLPGPHWHGLLHLPLGKKHHLHLCLGHRLHLGTLRSPPTPSRETPIGRLACCVWPRRALVRPTAVARCAWQCACMGTPVPLPSARRSSARRRRWRRARPRAGHRGPLRFAADPRRPECG